ncbi:MAG: hypothetical protein RL026_1443 [Pseudomonadota bacterium]
MQPPLRRPVRGTRLAGWWLGRTRLFGVWTRRAGRAPYLGLAAVAMLAVALNLLALANPIGGLDDRLFDKLVRYRLSSPAPSPQLLIVDIDERSLERVGRDHGRWPWPREVLAESLALIAESGARAVFVDVLFTEPDPLRPDGDRALQEVAAAYPQLVFPMLRLPAANDVGSALEAGRLPGARPLRDDGAPAGSDRVAVVLPAFASLQQRMGATNIDADVDGIVRSYRYWIRTRDHLLPSAAAATLLAAGVEPPSADAAPRRLNWRNRNGTYPRLSFSELYAGMQGETTLDPATFRDRIVVFGASAAGISAIRPTAQSVLTDDNLLLATAIDDGLRGSGLQMLGRHTVLALSLLMIGGLAWAFVAGADQTWIDRSFAGSQLALLAVVYLGISYTHWHLDLLIPFNAALLYFAWARSLQATRQASLRGHPQFWDPAPARQADRALVVSVPLEATQARPAFLALQQSLEGEFGHAAVLHLTDVVDRNCFLGETVGAVELLVAFVDRGLPAGIAAQLAELQQAGAGHHEVDIRALDAEASREAVWKAVVAAVFAGRREAAALP